MNEGNYSRWDRRKTAHEQVRVAHAGPQRARQARVQVLDRALLQDALLALQPHAAAHALRRQPHAPEGQTRIAWCASACPTKPPMQAWP